MANQYTNKVIVNGRAIIDLTSDTVAPENLLEGYTAHDKTGAPVVGTAKSGGGDSACFFKAINVPSAVASGEFLLASKSDLAGAGIINSELESILDGWNNVHIFFEGADGTRAITLSAFSSAGFTLGNAGSGPRFYLTTGSSIPIMVSSSIGTAYAGAICENASGIFIGATNNLRIAPGTAYLSIIVSGKK